MTLITQAATRYMHPHTLIRKQTDAGASTVKQQAHVESPSPQTLTTAASRANAATNTDINIASLTDALKSRNSIHRLERGSISGRASSAGLHFAGRETEFPNVKSPVMIAAGYEDEYLRAVAAESSGHTSRTMAGVIEEIDGHMTILDLDTKFFSQGVVHVEGPVTDQLASRIRKQLHHLISQRKKSGENTPIFLMVDSPGGSMFAMLAIADAINMVKNTKVKDKNIPVIALIHGMAASAGSVIAASATRCYMTPNSFYMLHAPISGRNGEWANLQDDMALTNRLLDRALTIYSEKTGYSKKDLGEWTYRGARWLDTEQSGKIRLSEGTVSSYDELAELDFSEAIEDKGRRPSLWSVDAAPMETTPKKAPPRRRTAKNKTVKPAPAPKPASSSEPSETSESK